MAKPLRHRWEITNVLQEHKNGLTLDDILKHFTPPLTGGGRTNAYATIRLRATTKGALDKLQKEGKVVFEDGVYKLNLALGKN